jgi:hypothetical protein
MRLMIAALVTALVTAIAQIITGVHGHLPPGGFAVLGLLAGMALVGAGKVLSALGLQRPLTPKRDD